jgi:hypothetical protein
MIRIGSTFDGGSSPRPPLAGGARSCPRFAAAPGSPVRPSSTSTTRTPFPRVTALGHVAGRRCPVSLDARRPAPGSFRVGSPTSIVASSFASRITSSRCVSSLAERHEELRARGRPVDERLLILRRCYPVGPRRAVNSSASSAGRARPRAGAPRRPSARSMRAWATATWSAPAHGRSPRARELRGRRRARLPARPLEAGAPQLDPPGRYRTGLSAALFFGEGNEERLHLLHARSDRSDLGVPVSQRSGPGR